MSAHSTHCCKIHGCKYGDDNCPVFNGDEKGIVCEDCLGDFTNPDKAEILRLKQQRDDLLAALKEVLESGEDGDWQSGRKIATEAIAKAEGA